MDGHEKWDALMGRGSGVNCLKSCILAYSWHLIIILKNWVFKSTSFSLLQKHISNDNFHFSQRIYTGYVLQNHWTESSNVGCQIDWWRRPVYPKKTTDKLYHYIKYTSSWVGFELTTLVVIGTDCTGTCKSNHHMITTMTTPSSRNITI